MKNKPLWVLVLLSFVSWTALFITVPIVVHKYNLMKYINKYLWLVPAIIIGLTLPYKFTGNALPYLYEFFNGLTGGYGKNVVELIGLQEAFIIFGLSFKSLRRYAAFGAAVTMLGAIATHVYLGEFDAVFAQAIVVLFTSLYLLKK